MAEVKTPAEILEEVSPFYKKRKSKAEAHAIDEAASEQYQITYDSPSDTLEPVYFWILDFMSGLFGGKIDKLVDNFTSAPGSGHFSELMGKATRMQEEAMKIYGTVNTIIKSILNIIYDLKEFQLRLKEYEIAKDKDKNKAQAGLLGLKQIWIDQVDIKKGRGSINMLAQDLNFVTLRDAFFVSDSLSDADKIDLNDRVKRILKARLQEFFEWKDRSEVELRKRFEIERNYLRTQVETVKMYSGWVKPYLIAAEQLRMKQQSSSLPSLINVFNTILLELAILGKKKIDVVDAAANHEIPEDFAKINFKRAYYSCVLIDFTFRGIPRRVDAQGHYAFGGRTEVVLRAYALNEDELALFKSKFEEASFGDSLKLIEGMTTESLDQIKAEVDEFLEEKSAKEKERYEKSAEQDVNPFAALVGLGAKKPQSAEPKGKPDEKKMALEKLKKTGVSSDNYAEGILRRYAEQKAIESCYSIYDIYKKAHDMASAIGQI